jgi:RNA polymerase sigma factor (sigma-70 family)
VRNLISDAFGEGALIYLTEREQGVISLLYYENKTFKDVGEIYGVTSVRIRQIKEMALRKIRSRLGLHGLMNLND